MNTVSVLKFLMILLLVGGLAAAPLTAAHSRRTEVLPAVTVEPDDDDAEGVTFDNLLPASSYTVYIEARNIGAVLRSAEFRETFEPISPMLEQIGGGAAEFLLVRLVIDQADRLQHSRVMMALNPVIPSLPGPLVAIELESEELAQEFETRMRESLAPLAAEGPARRAGDTSGKDHTDSTPAAIHRAGKLIALSATPFTFKALHGTSDELMSEDMNFRSARDHFYAEPLFIYYDIALAEHRKGSAGNQPGEEDLRRATAVASPAIVAQNTTSASSVLPVSGTPLAVAPPAAPATTSASGGSIAPPRSKPSPAPGARGSRPTAPAPSGPAANQSPARVEQDLLGSLFNLLLSGEGQSNDGLAVALALENDALAVRALLVSAPGATVGPVPFLSLPVSGPAISSEAANYLPADTDIFVTASLDWARLIEMAALQSRTLRGTAYGRATPSPAEDFAARRAAFEKANHVRLGDLLAATLGNGIALSLPASYLNSTPLGRLPIKARVAPAEPLLLINVRDRELLAPKLRPLLDAVGVRLTNAKAVTEKAGGIEITSYSNLACAFIDNYLIIASSAAGIRRAIEARTSNTTLAASLDFQSYTWWQPRATIAQVYVSARALKGLFPDRSQSSETKEEAGKQIELEAVKEFLARHRFDPEPVTYAASVEGVGAHYELRVPKRLLMRFFSEIAASEVASRIPRDESMARGFLQALKEQEKAYKTQHNRYAALDELEDGPMIRTMFERFGYKLEVTASDSGYEATMTPVEYGKTGRLSFYTDQSGVVREGDHNGKPASSADKPTDSKREY